MLPGKLKENSVSVLLGSSIYEIQKYFPHVGRLCSVLHCLLVLHIFVSKSTAVTPFRLEFCLNLFLVLVSLIIAQSCILGNSLNFHTFRAQKLN